MRNGVGDTPTGQGRKSVVEGAEKSSGKKLVQARLPFKKKAGESGSGSGNSSRKGSASAKSCTVVSADEKGAHHETRKRKLSFDDASDEQEEEQRILRNLSAINQKNMLASAQKKKKVDGSGSTEIILLDDDDEDNVAKVESAAKATKAAARFIREATPTSSATPQLVNEKREKGASAQSNGQDGPQDKSESSSRKLHIKLPLGVGSNGKRRKPISELLMKTATRITTDKGMEHSGDEGVSGVVLPSKRRPKLEEAEKENKEKELLVTIELSSDNESQSELGSSGATEEADGADCEGSCSSLKCKTVAVSPQTPTSSNVGKVMVRNAEKEVEADNSGVDGCAENVQPGNKVGHNSTSVTVSLNEIETSNEQERTTAECPGQAEIADSSDCTDTTNDKDQPAELQGDRKVDVSQVVAVRKKHLTPKQQKLLEQRRQVREEKERRLQEERLQKQREKEAREMMRKREREEREEQRRKEREEREEQRRKEREEKERARLAELEAKNEEKRKRNEAKEEELRKKEEERRRKEQEKEEAEQKAKKAADAFQKFFKPKRSAVAVAAVVETRQVDALKQGAADYAKVTLAFQPFEVKGDMSLAPVCRKTLSTVARIALDKSLKVAVGDGNQNDDTESLPRSQLYLAALKSGKIIPEKWRRPTVNTKDDDDDVLLMEDDLEPAGQAIIEETHIPIERFRAKFYKFWENRRPPYFGTWRKKTSVVTARRPFAKDKQFLDYDVDSDLEWEEEEPGESLDGSDDDKEKESEDDDYEVDNEWFVPHGHLSEEELQHEDDADANTREAQQAKLQILQREFAQEMKKKTEKLKPRLIGCIWADENGNQPTCSKINWDTLCQHAMLCAVPPLMEDADAQERTEPGSPNTNGIEKLKPIVLNERMLRDLTRLVHGNRHSKNFLIKEFIAYLEASEETIKSGNVRGPLKSMVREKIDEYAEWQAVDTKMYNNKSQEQNKKKKKKRLCWIVADDVLQRMGLAYIGLHNSWHYTLQPKFADADKPTLQADDTIKTAVAPADETNCIVTVANTREVTATIHTIAEPADATKPLTDGNLRVATPQAKKRVPLLMSVARGQKISQPAKNALISEYLKRSSAEKADVTNMAERVTPTVAPSMARVVADVTDGDDVVMLD